MPEFIPPEPDRSTFDSDAAFNQAWLQWADSTPGGWRARMAERAATREQTPPSRPRRIPVEWIDKPPADPGAGAHDIGCSNAPSPCCAVMVVVDPHNTEAVKGLCSSCAALLDYVGTWWEIDTRGA